MWSIKSSPQIDEHVNIFRLRGSVYFPQLIPDFGHVWSGPKKMTHKDNGPGPGRNYGETAVFTFFQIILIDAAYVASNSTFPCSLFLQQLMGCSKCLQERVRSAQFHVLEIKEEMRLYNR